MWTQSAFQHFLFHPPPSPPAEHWNTHKTSMLSQALWRGNWYSLTQTFDYCQEGTLFSETVLVGRDRCTKGTRREGLGKYENSKHLSKAACSSMTPTHSSWNPNIPRRWAKRRETISVSWVIHIWLIVGLPHHSAQGMTSSNSLYWSPLSEKAHSCSACQHWYHVAFRWNSVWNKINKWSVTVKTSFWQ